VENLYFKISIPSRTRNTAFHLTKLRFFVHKLNNRLMNMTPVSRRLPLMAMTVVASAALSGCAWLGRILGSPAPAPEVATQAPAPAPSAPPVAAPPPAAPSSALPPRRNGPLTQLVVLLDEDFINTAFDAYVSSVPTRRPDAKAFTAALAQSLRSGLSSSEVAAELHVLSFKDSSSRARVRLQNRPTLVMRMLNSAVNGRPAVASLGNRGWDGNSVWRVELSEPGVQSGASQAYAVSWEGRLDNVRLDPQQCKTYETCGQELARTVLAQLREDAVIRVPKAAAAPLTRGAARPVAPTAPAAAPKPAAQPTKPVTPKP
jgi:hypothetical protein